MPIESPNYPTSERDSRFKSVAPAAHLQGYVVNPGTGDVMVAVAANYVQGANRQIYDALGYLDVLHDRSRRQEEVLTWIARQVEALGNAVAALSTKIDALGVTIPAWRLRAEVLSGGWDDDMGVVWTPGAAELGLQVEFEYVQNFDDQTPGRVFGIEPEAGTFVSRGTRVKVTCNPDVE